MSSGRGMKDDSGVVDKEPFDTSGGWCRTRAPTVRVPAWHEAVRLRTFEVRGGALEGRVVRMGAEAALAAFGTVADAVIGEDFPTFIAEAGIRGHGAPVRVRSSQGVKGVFVSEDAPE